MNGAVKAHEATAVYSAAPCATCSVMHSKTGVPQRLPPAGARSADGLPVCSRSLWEDKPLTVHGAELLCWCNSPSAVTVRCRQMGGLTWHPGTHTGLRHVTLPADSRRDREPQGPRTEPRSPPPMSPPRFESMQHKPAAERATLAAILTDDVENLRKAWLAVHNMMAVFVYKTNYGLKKPVRTLRRISPTLSLSHTHTHTHLPPRVRGRAAVWARHTLSVSDRTRNVPLDRRSTLCVRAHAVVARSHVGIYVISFFLF